MLPILICHPVPSAAGATSPLPLEPGQLEGLDSRIYRTEREDTIKQALEIMEVRI